MYNMKTMEFEQFGLCSFFRTIVLKHAELAKRSEIGSQFPYLVLTIHVYGSWVETWSLDSQCPNQQQILCGHHFLKRPEIANNKHLMEYDCKAIYTKAQSGSARNSHSNNKGSRISRVISVAKNFMEACLESI
jgi:hypothetical protein